METLFKIVGIVSAIAASWVSLIKFTHFFQLNSYRAKLQGKWMSQNTSKLIPNLMFGILGAAAAFLANTFGNIIFIVMMLFGLLLSKPQKAKKPLVYTMRVKRLLVTSTVLFAVIITIGILCKQPLIVSSIMFLISPFVIMAANIINMPVEKSINNYYINDAKKMLENSNAVVIGITGSYGKTSLKYFLTTLLKAKYNVLMTPESFNTPMGIVKTIRQKLNALHEIFVCEMGAKRVGEIKEICDIVHPVHGIITSIGPQHLETFKSLENIKKTKFELADALPANGNLFLNVNDENINSHKGNRKNISYSVNGNGTYNASVISVGERGTIFEVTAPDGQTEEFTTRLIGTHNVLNITGAIAVANTMGVDFASLKAQVRKLKSVPHRLELINRGNDIIIDDAYNANPSGTKAALETLSCFDGIKILLTPGMVELGEKQDELNHEFGKNAARICDYVILVGRKQTKSIKSGLEEAGYPDDKTYVATDLNDALNYAYTINSHNIRKIILLENDLPDNY